LELRLAALGAGRIPERSVRASSPAEAMRRVRSFSSVRRIVSDSAVSTSINGAGCSRRIAA
jgi:hypothetical protein